MATPPIWFVLGDVKKEREEQDKKFGKQDHTLGNWCTILMEEVLEAVREFNAVIFTGASPENLRKELIQVAAVCVHIAQKLDQGYKT